MLEDTVKAATTDPVRLVADALDSAVLAVRGGVDDARASASGAWPGLVGFLSRLTYQTCFAVSYGVVFPVVLVARAIPRENPAVHGLVDGAHAAIHSAAEKMPTSLSIPTLAE